MIGNAESSMTLKSNSSVNKSISIAESSNKVTEQNAAFSLMEYLIQKVQLSGVIYWVFGIIMIIQYNFSWYYLCFPANRSSSFYTIFEVFLLRGNESYISLLIFVSAVFVSFGLKKFQDFSYKKTRQYIHWAMFPLRILFELFPLILLSPLYDSCGRLILKIFYQTSTTFEIFVFISAIIATLYFSRNLIYFHQFMGKSVVFENQLFSIFNPILLINFVVYTPIFLFVMPFLEYFENWSRVLVVSIHIVFNLNILRMCFYLPFIKQYTNVLLLSQGLWFVFFDIMVIVNKDIPSIFFGLILFCIVSSSILVYYRVDKLISHLNKNEESAVNINEKLNELSIGVNNDITQMYLHYGLSEICDSFIDFSLIKYIIQFSQNRDSLSTCIRVLAFFPSETRLLNLITSTFLQRRDLTEPERFLIFQIRKIKILRQSSSSSQASDTLGKLKLATRQTENSLKSFLSFNNISLESLKSYISEMNGLNGLWEEALKNFPNSAEFLDEYIRFLVECQTDYGKAIFYKNKAIAVESGKTYSVDYSFRSLVSSFPQYLKQSILDVKGNFIKKDTIKKGSNTRTDSSSNEFNLSSIDLKMEEEIGRALYQQSRTRLALQRATEDMKGYNSRYLRIVNISLFIFSIMIFLGVFVIFLSFFDQRYKATERSYFANRARFHYAKSALLSLYFWSNNTFPKKIGFSHINENSNSENFDINFISNPYHVSILKDIKESRVYLSKFLNSMSELSQEGVSVRSIANTMFSDTVERVYCSKGIRVNQEKSDLQNILVYQLFQIQMLLSNSDYNNWWFNSTEFCTLLSSHSFIGNGFATLRQSLILDESTASNSVQTNLEIFEYVVPSGFLIISLFLVLVFTNRYKREIMSLAEFISITNKESIMQAKQPILKSGSETSDNLSFESSMNNESNTMIFLYSILFILEFCCVSATVFYIFATSIDLNQEFLNNAIWSYLSSLRSPTILDILIALSQVVILKDPEYSLTNITNSSANTIIMEKAYSSLLKFSEDLLMGTDKVKALIGQDSIIDELSIKERCKPSLINASFHDYYKCSAINQLQISFGEMIREIKLNMNSYNGSLDHYMISHFIHLSIDHMIPLVQLMDQRLTEMITIRLLTYDNTIRILSILGFLLSVLSMISIQSLVSSLDSAHLTLVLLLRRFPPVGIINNNKLLGYLLNQNSDKGGNDSTIEGSIVNNSNDGIICINLNGIVEIVNPSVTSILGFSPEQLLGQSIETIFDKESFATINNQITLMNSHQSSSTYEGHIICIDDSDQKIPCSLTLNFVGSSGESSESYVVIIRDERELFRQQKEAEEAKQKSENLLYQILPRDIVVKLNQGEKEITFVVPSASVMFIDIVKFSEYSSTLSPQEILGNLSQIFSSFDDSLSKYPLITKIKLIGDVYMCAAGLFSPNEPPSSHAEQIIKFGLDALQQLEELNLKLNANLTIRIGVNSGGPLIAGVLGTDKPVFDIIGDTINVASRLQSTDIPGKIQISQATYEYVKDLGFFIEHRGETFLKGKGKTQTYLVSPPQMIFQLVSSQMSGDSQVHLG